MQTNNFFTDLVKRFLTKNPKFFRYIQIGAAVLIVLSQVFTFLTGQNVVLPGWAVVISAGVTKAIAWTALIVAQFPNINPPAPTAEETKK